MSKYFNLRRIALFLFVIFFMASCKDDDKTIDGATTTAASTNTANPTIVNPAKSTFTGVTLDTLLVEASKFDSLPKGRLVLQFKFDKPDKLTLHGWCAKGILDDDFDTPPIKLKNGNPGNYNFEPDMYFGNILIRAKHVQDIKDAIKKYGALFVVFAPKKPVDLHVTYDILLSKEDPNLVKVLTITDTNVDGNPSPPKNYLNGN